MDTHGGSKGKQLVEFRIGDESFGIDIAAVQEIMRMPRITVLPMAPAVLEGIVNFRGRVAPVVNLRERLGREPQGEDSSEQLNLKRLLVVTHEGKTFGLVVDAVNAVVGVEEEAIEPLAGLLTTASAFVSGLIKRSSGVLLVLDLPGVLGVAPQEAAAGEASARGDLACEQRETAPLLYPLRPSAAVPTTAPAAVAPTPAHEETCDAFKNAA